MSAYFSVGNYASPEIRCHKNRQVTEGYKKCGQAVSNQGEIWEDVEQVGCRLAVDSPTMAMKDVFDRRAIEFESFVKALPYPEDARGMLAAVSGRFAAMDALDRPEMFKCVWDRLVNACVVDAIGREEVDAKPFTEKSARFIFDSLLECKFSVFKGVELGQELRFESDVVLGQAMVVDEVVVHISIFPNDQIRKGRKGEHDYIIMPPSFRRRSRRSRGQE